MICSSDLTLILDMSQCIHNSSSVLDFPEALQIIRNLTERNQSWSNNGTGSSGHMTWWIQIAWSSIFSIMVFIAVWGNLLFMWIVLVSQETSVMMSGAVMLVKRVEEPFQVNTRSRTGKTYRPMRRVTNFLLVNLSIADLLMAVINCLFNFVYMLHRDWWFGDGYCVANNFMATLTVSASVFTLTGITIDRYLAIVKPLQPRMSKAAAELIIILIWSCAIIVAFPSLLYSSTITEQTREKNRTSCILIWPDGRPTESHLDRIYNLVILLVTYILPMIVMIICYTAMSRELRRSRAIGEMTRAQQDSINSKRKIVRLFVFIVATFGICWLPYHSYFIYTNYYTSVLHSKFIQHIYLAFYWLAMCNAMVNPFIYYWINNRFRKHFIDAIWMWRRGKSRKSSTRTITMRIAPNKNNEQLPNYRSDNFCSIPLQLNRHINKLSNEKCENAEKCDQKRSKTNYD